MSNPDTDSTQTPVPEFDRLERALERLVGALAGARSETAEVRADKERCDALLRELSAEGHDPAALSARVAHLEAENARLRRRLDRGNQRIDRILTIIRFMEDNQ